MPTPTDILVLGSGGPDSLIAYEFVSSVNKVSYPEQRVIYGRCSLPTWGGQAEELALAFIFREKLLGDHAKIFVLPGLTPPNPEDEKANFPARNLLLLTIAAACRFQRLVIAIQQDEQSAPDRSDTFLTCAADTLSRATNEDISVSTPFASMDKTDMVRWMLDTAQDAGEKRRRVRLLEASWSCYAPVRTAHTMPYMGSTEPGPYVHCGVCPACVRRYIAFKPAGVNTLYANDPVQSKQAERYRMAVEKKEYSDKRCSRIRDVLGVEAPANDP